MSRRLEDRFFTTAPLPSCYQPLKPLIDRLATDYLGGRELDHKEKKDFYFKAIHSIFYKALLAEYKDPSRAWFLNPPQSGRLYEKYGTHYGFPPLCVDVREDRIYDNSDYTIIRNTINTSYYDPHYEEKLAEELRPGIQKWGEENPPKEQPLEGKQPSGFKKRFSGNAATPPRFKNILNASQDIITQSSILQKERAERQLQRAAALEKINDLEANYVPLQPLLIEGGREPHAARAMEKMLAHLITAANNHADAHVIHYAGHSFSPTQLAVRPSIFRGLPAESCVYVHKGSEDHVRNALKPDNRLQEGALAELRSRAHLFPSSHLSPWEFNSKQSQWDR